MIYFQKGIFIYTSSRGGLGEGGEEKRSFFFFLGPVLILVRRLCHRGFCLTPLITRNLKQYHFSETSNYGIWKGREWHYISVKFKFKPKGFHNQKCR